MTAMEIIEPFLAKIDSAIGARYSAVLYGSVARGEHLEGVSDINLLLIMDQLDSSVLIRLEPSFSGWVDRKLPPPILMTRSEWLRASDVFPVEITDMKIAYRVLRGMDPLGDLVVGKSDLRRALEREFRGKLNRLRQGYVPSERDPGSLGMLARQSIASVATLYRSLLVLLGRTVPGQMGEVLAQAGAAVGFDGGALAAIAAHRGEESWTCSREDFERYLLAVERTVGYVDELQLGDQE